MKKKRINIVLIIVVVGLWGTLIYKYFRPHLAGQVVSQSIEYQNNNEVRIATKDTFELRRLDFDPFFNKVVNKSVVFTSNAAVSYPPKKPVVKNLNKVFPTVSYFGYIKSTKRAKEMILIKINQQLKRVRLNQIIDGLIIKSIYRDSIEVVFQGEARTIKR